MTSHLGTVRRWTTWTALVLAATAWHWAGPLALKAQLIYTENFNTDGEKEGRYTTFGRGNTSTSAGPAYWEHSSLLGNVGTNNKALARRAGILWSHDIDPAEWTEDALAIFDATVDWTMSGKKNANIYITPSAVSLSDEFIAQRLSDLGHTVLELGAADPVPTKDQADLIIHSSAGGVNNPTQFNSSDVPLLTYNDGNHDDIAISTIGTVQTIQPTVDIRAPGHPAAGGKTGAIQWTNSAVSLHTLGPVVAPKGTVVADYTVSTPAQLTNLAQVDDMISGKLGSVQTKGQIDVADLNDDSPGRWTFDNPIPGVSLADDYAVVTTGKLSSKGGDFSFAISGDDGGRLRIDLNQDGKFDNADNVIVDDALHGHTDAFADRALPAGDFDFQWVGFERSGGAGWELSYADGFGNRDLVGADTGWEALGDPDGFLGLIDLKGPMEVTTYKLDAPPITETRAAVFVVEAGEELLGGSITGFEGAGFWAGADMNEPTIEGGGCCTTPTEPRELTLKAVDVTGKQDVKLTVGLAATVLDFENTDYLRIQVDIDGDGPKDFQTLANFIGQPTKDLSDGTTSLGTEFQDVTFDIPDGATNLVVRFQSQSTFYNEIVAFDNVRIHSGSLVIPGDINGDGKVDLTDFGILKANFGSGNEPGEGDIDGDGKVDLTDFGILKANFGKGGAASVPEPSTMALCLAAGAAWLMARRRRRAGTQDGGVA